MKRLEAGADTMVHVVKGRVVMDEDSTAASATASGKENTAIRKTC